MRDLDPDVYAALSARKLVARDFIWFIVRDAETGAPVTDGYWSGAGNVVADVIDPNTGGVVAREFRGAGALIQISDIPLVSNITVQNITIQLNQVMDRINDLVRSYDCKQGTVQVWRGLYNPETRKMVAAATPRFYGFIDTIDINTPSENSEGGVVLTCTSHTQEMTRSNSDTRSDAAQRLRSATDNFYQDTTVVGNWQHFWGRANGAVSTPASNPYAGWKPIGVG